MLASRRDMLKFGLGGAATLLLPGMGFPVRASAEALRDDPHFFLMIMLKGGADTSYMFDARPLAMTQAGKIQNYLGIEPTPWVGQNGTAAHATSLVRPLMPFRDRFSVLNGVVMTPSFVGHEQNINFLFTGDPFGGNSFIPHLNLPETGRTPNDVDAIIPAESEEARTANTSGIIPLEPRILDGLPEELRKLPPAHANDPVTSFVKARLDVVAKGNGAISEGAAIMQRALNNSPGVHRKLAALSSGKSDASAEQQGIDLIAECFRLSLSRAAIYVLPEQFDVHAPELAKGQPQLFGDAIGRIAALLQGLVDTPFDSKRSMFDVTTVMIASEFGRTMRELDTDVNETGTDHNQYSNSVLLGGRGVRSGLVLGASDMNGLDAPVSKAHLEVDPDLLKSLGVPFDFKTLTPRSDLPESFQIADYLTIGSAVNTIYSLFGVPVDYYRTMSRDGGPAPILNGLIG